MRAVLPVYTGALLTTLGLGAEQPVQPGVTQHRGSRPPGTVTAAYEDRPPPTDSCLARVTKNGKYGFINPAGELVIPIKFDHAASVFCEGLASVQLGEVVHFIDERGAVVLSPPVRSAANFSDGMSVVSDKSKQRGYIDRSGKVVIPCEYDMAMAFEGGVAWVGNATLAARTRALWQDVGWEEFDWFLIDKRGRKVNAAPPKPLPAIPALRPVLTSGKGYGFVDASGAEVVAPLYRNARQQSEGLCAALGPKGWVFVDETGREVLGPFPGDLISVGYHCGVVGFEVRGNRSTPSSRYFDRKGTQVWPKPEN